MILSQQYLSATEAYLFFHILAYVVYILLKIRAMKQTCVWGKNDK